MQTLLKCAAVRARRSMPAAPPPRRRLSWASLALAALGVASVLLLLVGGMSLADSPAPSGTPASTPTPSEVVQRTPTTPSQQAEVPSRQPAAADQQPVAAETPSQQPLGPAQQPPAEQPSSPQAASASTSSQPSGTPSQPSGTSSQPSDTPSQPADTASHAPSSPPAPVAPPGQHPSVDVAELRVAVRTMTPAVLGARPRMRAVKGCLSKPVAACDRRKLVVWSLDFHPGPAQDVQTIVRDYVGPRLGLDVEYRAFSFAAYCEFTNTCTGADDIKGLTPDNAYQLCPRPHRVRAQFFTHYHADAEFQQVDLFVCTMPASLCQLFLPFGRAMVVVHPVTVHNGVASTNGYYRKEWGENQRLMTERGLGAVFTNNEFHQRSLHKYVGKRHTLPFVPSLSMYTNATWTPASLSSGQAIIISKMHNDDCLTPGAAFANDLAAMNATVGKAGYGTMSTLHDVFGGRPYAYEELAASAAFIILIPWTVSFMTAYEAYAMGIPIFAPSFEFVRRHSQCVLRNKGAKESYVNQQDYMRFAGVQLFDSAEHFAQLISSVDLNEVARVAAQGFRVRKEQVLLQWEALLRRLVGDGGAMGQAPGGRTVVGATREWRKRCPPDTSTCDFPSAMEALYGPNYFHFERNRFSTARTPEKRYQQFLRFGKTVKCLRYKRKKASPLA